jgi:hypothetical protein
VCVPPLKFNNHFAKENEEEGKKLIKRRRRRIKGSKISEVVVCNKCRRLFKMNKFFSLVCVFECDDTIER